MTSPENEQEELLSSFMDDAVTPEQRREVQRLLASDPALAADLDSLRRGGEQLRQLDQVDAARHQLPPGFADQVIDAAAQQARLEGCQDDHPLMRVTEHPVEAPASTRFRWAAAASIVLTIAASLALVFALMPRDVELDEPSKSAVALAEIPDDANAGDDLSTVASNPVNQTNARPDTSNRADPTDLQDPSNSPDIANLVDTTTTPPRQRADDAIVMPSRDDADASIDSDVLRSLAASATAQSAIDRRKPSSVLVLDIRLKDESLGLRPVRRAMEMARLANDDEQAIDRDIMTAIAGSLGQGDANGSLMYLRAPAKQLDRFITNLMLDRQSIASVGLGIAIDAPVLQVASEFAEVDVTKIRHDFAGQLDDEQAAELAHSLQNQIFVPMSGDAADLGVADLSPRDGLDVMSNLFLIIR